MANRTLSTPEAVPYMGRERRDSTRRQQVVTRIRSEYASMPGMCLTLSQASRLFGLPSEACARVMNELVRDRTLTVDRERYRADRG